MKYNTISSSSLSSEGRKSTLTLYTDPDFLHEKQLSASESEMSSIKGELEIVQRALKLQTRRCRQLVAEYTRRLQEKEQQYQSEKLLRDSQLTKVLRALLIFEARLKQEQKYISHQLKEKDYIIKRQCDDISKLSNQYCKHCNQFYSPVRNLESLDSSSEYVGTDYQDYQSSNVESLDSSSETYATISEKDFPKLEEKLESEGKIYQKNKVAIKRGRKIGHRKSVGTYFEVLKLRKDAVSPSSNDDNTSNDYENLESLPAESISGKISTVSERIEKAFADNLTEDNLDKHDNQFVLNESRSEEETLQNVDDVEEAKPTDEETENNLINETLELSKIQEDEKVSKITESIPVFEADEGETNDNWYASASDQEDDEQRDVYRNNPVLECMNQILMQNINDNPSTPPKSPTMERRQAKNNNKRVKFSDEDLVHKENLLNAENLNYYETPIQKAPNFYETPQSIYSNDYEQILSKCNESFVHPIPEKPQKPEPIDPPHYYIDMDPNQNPTKKTKILRTPPALPPKPANLLSKYKLQNLPKSPDKSSTPSIDSEPDYCSISELNLPTKAKKLTVVAEINIPNESIKTSEKHIILHSPKQKDCKTEKPKPLVVNKSVEKLNIQVAKQTPIKTESPTKAKPKLDQEIPMLPQVSEIIIPEEVETNKVITHDNYIKNNSQILKTKKPESARRSILIGTSVSSLITGFNNQQLLSEIHSKSPKGKLNKKMFASFESLQNIEKQSKPAEKSPDDSHDFTKFDLSQNFEEFKLDDCEIEEYNVDNNIDTEEVVAETKEETQEEHVLPDILTTPTKMSSTRVELVRATNDVSVPTLNQATIQQLKKKLELDKSKEVYQSTTVNNGSEPSYEHFLECTGLSSKSILTPSRLLSNHKSMLKPKDVKLRSKVKSNVLDKQSNTIKYWSEPYI